MPKAWQRFSPHEGSQQPPVGWGGGASAPCPLCHARQRSQLPAFSHARWCFTKQTLQRLLAFPGDAPPPNPVPLNRSLSEQPNEIPAASSWLELPPPSRLRGRSMAAASTCWRGPGCSMVRPQISSPETPVPLLSGVPAAPAPGAPRSPPALALLQSHSFAKRSWQKPRDQLETALIPGRRRGTKAPHHLRPSRKYCWGFRGEAKNTPLALIAGEHTRAPPQDTTSHQGQLQHRNSTVAGTVGLTLCLAPGGCPGPGWHLELETKPLKESFAHFCRPWPQKKHTLGLPGGCKRPPWPEGPKAPT